MTKLAAMTKRNVVQCARSAAAQDERPARRRRIADDDLIMLTVKHREKSSEKFKIDNVPWFFVTDDVSKVVGFTNYSNYQDPEFTELTLGFIKDYIDDVQEFVSQVIEDDDATPETCAGALMALLPSMVAKKRYISNLLQARFNAARVKPQVCS